MATSETDDELPTGERPVEPPTTPGAVVAVVLAAGAGSRFAGDTHKLLADVDGRPLVDHAIQHAVDARVGPVVTVTGAVDLSVVTDRYGDRVTTIHNPRWADGQASSLGVALAHGESIGAAAVVVALADQPGLATGCWRRVAASDAAIAVATHDGRRGHPVRLAREVWPLIPTTGDEGARSLLRLRPDLVQEIPCPGSAADIDTLEDLKSWQNRSSTNSP